MKNKDMAEMPEKKKLPISDYFEVDDDFIDKVVEKLNKVDEIHVPKIYRLSEVAKIVNKDVNTIRIHHREGYLKTIKPNGGRILYVTHEDLQNYINQRYRSDNG